MNGKDSNKHKSACCEESTWTSIIRSMRIYHGDCIKKLDETGKCTIAPPKNIENYNTNTFTKTFAFWKIYLIFFFLLGIGIANLISKKEKSWEYMEKNRDNFIIEFFYLFGAFLLSTIFMYIIRIGKISIWTIIKSSFVIFIFCLFKHLAFELSGLYRFNFGSKECNKEHFDTSDFSTYSSDISTNSIDISTNSIDISTNSIDISTNCDCDNGMFSGLFWNGLGFQGMVITIILILFFGISLVKPKSTEKFFNYKFNWLFCLIFITIILAAFFIGFFIINGNIDEDKSCPEEKSIYDKIKEKCALRDKKCTTEDDIFTRIKDGCAVVSIFFLTLITLIFIPILLWHLIGWAFNKEFTDIEKKTKVTFNTDKSKLYNDCYWKSTFMRFILTLIESIIIFLIFAFAEAGIESLRKGHPIDKILLDKHFWEKSAKMTLPGILLVQFLLEYTNWFKEHLFNDEKNTNKCYTDHLGTTKTGKTKTKTTDNNTDDNNL